MRVRKSKSIIVKGIVVTTQKHGQDDFISLTDMAKYKSYDSGVVIANWLSTKYTIQFMGAWEQVHNPKFNLIEFHKIKNEAGSNQTAIDQMKSLLQIRKVELLAEK